MSTPNPFAQPGKTGDFFSPRNNPDWLGRLFIFYPESTVTKTFNPEEGPKEFVIADVAIVDLPDPQTGQPVFIKGATVGGTALVPAINRDRIGKMVLGRLRKGAPQGQKDGAYYLEQEQSPQDITLGTAYLASHPRQQFTPPNTQQQAPPQQQWGQQPAAAPPQYDVWQHTQAAPAGPPQGQWGAPAPAAQAPAPVPAPGVGAPAPGNGNPQWGNPAASAQAALAPAPPVSPSAVDAATLAAFLTSKNVPVQSMTEDQVRMIASTYPDCPQAQRQAPPF